MLREKLKELVMDCMEDAQGYKWIDDDVVNPWVDKIMGAISDRNMTNAVYISPDVEKFLANDDALSQEMTVFRHGGSVGSKRAIPYIRAFTG